MLCGLERSIPFLLLCLLQLGCLKESEPAPEVPGRVFVGRLVLNELVASGSMITNEFGQHGDWVELYNPGPAIHLEAGEWYLADRSEGDAEPFELPSIDIPEQGYLLIWCDGEDLVTDEIHADFALSSKDGSVRLLHMTDERSLVVDEVPITDGTQGHASMGRTPDGTANWTRLSPQTPGTANELVVAP